MTYEDVLSFCEEQDVRFIRLSYFDIYGRQKNVSVLPTELKRAFTEGISFDASAIDGFLDEVHSDLFLFPDPNTMSILPWRSMDGSVIRMYCDIQYPDGTPFERDVRYILRKAVKKAKEKGITINFGSEFEFYLFKQDENGNNTFVPLDVSVPILEYHFAPFNIIFVMFAYVSTLLINVGFCHNPELAGNGGFNLG